MTFTTLFSVLFSLLTNLSYATQDFHLTTATIICSAQDRSMRVELEVYASNMNELLTQLADFEVDLAKPKDLKIADELLEEYLAQNFLLIQKGKMLPLALVDIKLVNDKVFVFFDIETNAFDEIALKNTLFFTFYADQINVVNVQSGSNSNKYYFNAQTPEQTIPL